MEKKNKEKFRGDCISRGEKRVCSGPRVSKLLEKILGCFPCDEKSGGRITREGKLRGVSGKEHTAPRIVAIDETGEGGEDKGVQRTIFQKKLYERKGVTCKKK